MAGGARARRLPKSVSVGIILAVNIILVGLVWHLRQLNSVLLGFSVAWVLLVTLFAGEIITRAERLDRIVKSRTKALEEANSHLSAVLGQLRAFHLISYEMNQELEIEQIPKTFVHRLESELAQVDSIWLWLDRAVLQVGWDDLPKGGEPNRPLELAALAGEDFGMPPELASPATGAPLLKLCFGDEGVAVVDLQREARRWGWPGFSRTDMRSFVGFSLRVGESLLGALGIFSKESMSAELVRQLQLSVNQLAIALEKARLMRRMRERAAELAALNEELRELDTMKDWFVSAVSHELRTPLTSIRSFSEILETYDDLGPEERREFAGIIRQESERLSEMISNVLDLAKIANGELKLNPEAIDLRGLAEECCRLFSHEADERGIQLRTIIPKGTPPAWADASNVSRVLHNLVGNAFKFTEDGGKIELSVEPGEPVAAGRRFVTILVSVSGIGIALEDQERVFERFTQVEGGLTDKAPGTGIGLAICREIVEKSGGDIWVRSAPGEGSVFGFTLPVADQEKEES